MLEMRARPLCHECELPVSSWAEGCLDCGVGILCQDCKEAHERKHQVAPEPIDADYDPIPGYPAAGYTQILRKVQP